jgi:hypothetical protein
MFDIGQLTEVRTACFGILFCAADKAGLDSDVSSKADS